MEKEFLNNFKEILDEEPNVEITLDTKFRDLDEWDSLTALSLIAMADEEYGVTITGDEIKEMSTLNEIFSKLK